VCLGTVAISPRTSGAASITTDRARAAALLIQINSINSQVERLSQRFDQTQLKLHRIQNEITNTKAVVASIQGKLDKGNLQLRADAVFAYVTNGSAASSNPLFSPNAAQVGATNVYNQLAEGNISTTLANLKNYRIKLTQERSILAAEDAAATSNTRVAATSFHSYKLLQASFKNTLAQVKGQIATYIAQAQATAAAKSAATLSSAPVNSGFPAPPPNSRANIAINAALGVWYSWGGASRSGVDCSGLTMLAYAAAGIHLSHYSGAQYNETTRVPLWNIQPGDLLFYGYNGDEHVSMYIGHNQVIEASHSGTQVSINPVNLGYGFVGLGRPRG
jgi:cell wall-associated NlpC family hydrolase